MKTFKFLLSVSLFTVLVTNAFAQKKDPVEIYGAGKDIVDVSEFPGIANPNHKWVRADIILDGKENPDKAAKTADEKKWIKDVSLDLTLAYVKPMAKDKWNPENWIVLKSKADLIAIEKGKKSKVSFFMSPELKDLYRLQDSQRLFFIIELSVLGTKVELSPKNFKKFISKELIANYKIIEKGKKIRTGIKSMADFEKVKADLAKASSVSESWLVPLPKAPFVVQYEEYYGKNKEKAYVIPTYKTDIK